MLNFPRITPVIKNLLILNILVFIAQNTFPEFNRNFMLFPFQSPDFEPYQLITHMFMHGDLTHLLFNMFTLYMLGTQVETQLGEKKFGILFLITGFGAVFLHAGVQTIENYEFIMEGKKLLNDGKITQNQLANGFINSGIYPILGASGAVFGVLLAFGMLFANNKMMILPIPIPIKAKYLVAVYIFAELNMGINGNLGDNVAHFAHLGGALFGFLLISYWKKKRLI